MLGEEKYKIRKMDAWPAWHLSALPHEVCWFSGDPNGALYWNGKYHVMYIHQDPANKKGVHCWGHASSTDLVNWTYHEPCLEPDDSSPETGIFSGNAFVSKEGRPMICYFGCGSGLAVATAIDDDLINWEKHPANPLIPCPKEGEPDFEKYRVWDPFLWYENGYYWALLGGNRHNDRDTLYVMKSTDLTNWEELGPFYEGDPSWRRPDEDCSCPDFFKLRDKYVLMCISHSIGARIYVGDFNAETCHFEPEQHVRMNWPGGMFFAPETLEAPDGRRIYWAWVTDPRVRPTQDKKGSGFQSLPRVLDLAPDGTPLMSPAVELEMLRKNHRTVNPVELTPDADIELPEVSGESLELAVEIDPGDAEKVGLKLFCSPDGEETVVVFDAAKSAITVDMSKSSLRDDIVWSSPPFTSYRIQNVAECEHVITSFDAPFELHDGETLKLRVFLDKPIIEVFVNDRQCVTQVVYTKAKSSPGIKFFAQGGTARVLGVDAWDMAPSHDQIGPRLEATLR